MSVVGYMGVGAEKQETKARATEMKIGAVDMEKENSEPAPKKNKKPKKTFSDEE